MILAPGCLNFGTPAPPWNKPHKSLTLQRSVDTKEDKSQSTQCARVQAQTQTQRGQPTLIVTPLSPRISNFFMSSEIFTSWKRRSTVMFVCAQGPPVHIQSFAPIGGPLQPAPQPLGHPRVLVVSEGMMCCYLIAEFRQHQRCFLEGSGTGWAPTPPVKTPQRNPVPSALPEVG